MRSGCLIRQRALQRGSLMAAPCLSSCVANPPSTTAQPPAFSITISNGVVPFFTPITLFQFFSFFFLFRKKEERKRVRMLKRKRNGIVFALTMALWRVGVNADEILFRFFSLEIGLLPNNPKRILKNK